MGDHGKAVEQPVCPKISSSGFSYEASSKVVKLQVLHYPLTHPAMATYKKRFPDHDHVISPPTG